MMERLDCSLDDLLETVPNIPLTLKHSMLKDIARGLLYLHKHEPQIIHKDLTAKNVLLTSSLVANLNHRLGEFSYRKHPARSTGSDTVSKSRDTDVHDWLM